MTYARHTSDICLTDAARSPALGLLLILKTGDDRFAPQKRIRYSNRSSKIKLDDSNKNQDGQMFWQHMRHHLWCYLGQSVMMMMMIMMMMKVINNEDHRYADMTQFKYQTLSLLRSFTTWHPYIYYYWQLRVGIIRSIYLHLTRKWTTNTV